MKRNLEKVFLNITNACNNNCLYCFQEKLKELIEMDYKTIVQLMDTFEKMGVKKLLISGGEPSLHSQFSDILDIADQYSFEVNLLTNGILDDMKIEKINNSNISKVYISLDGAKQVNSHTRGEENFCKAEKSIMKINKKIIIMNTLNRENYMNTLDFLNYCSKFTNIEKINFNPIKILNKRYENLSLTKYMIDYVNNIIEEFSRTSSIKIRSYYNFKSEKIMNCGAGITSLSINYNGDISGCIFGTALGVSDFISGNIMDCDIEQLWNEESNWNQFLIVDDQNCKKCSFLSERCTGLCKIEKKVASINKLGCKYLCRLSK